MGFAGVISGSRALLATAAAMVALVVALLGSANADAAVQVGKQFAGPGDAGFNGSMVQYVPFAVNAWEEEPGYRVPFTGVVTSWRIYNPGGTTRQVRLKLGVGGDDGNAMIRVQSALETLNATPGQRQFQTRIWAQNGTMLGLFASNGDGMIETGATGKLGVLTKAGDVDVWTLGQPALGWTAGAERILNVAATIEPDADGDGWGDETQDKCKGAKGDNEGCPPPSSLAKSSPTSRKTARERAEEKRAKQEAKKKGKGKTRGKGAPSDFNTATFDGVNLQIRLKCPGRFKPGCVGKAVAVTGRDRCSRRGGKRVCQRGKAMSSSVSAGQKANQWMVVSLTVKPKHRAKVAQMAKQPRKKLLHVKQTIRAEHFKGGRSQAVFHSYRVRSAK